MQNAPASKILRELAEISREVDKVMNGPKTVDYP